MVATFEIQEPITVDIPQGDSATYVINRAELLDLVERGLLKPKDKLFIYFALTLDYPDGAEGLHISSFCKRWGVAEPDAMVAIAQLEKKDILQQEHRQLAFRFVYPES